MGYEEYNTPYFTIDRADHKFTTQDEMMDFLEEHDAAEDQMYLYSLGTTPAYGYNMAHRCVHHHRPVLRRLSGGGRRTVSANGKLRSARLSLRFIPTSPPPARAPW